MEQWTTLSAQETFDVAKELGGRLKGDEILAFSGELGAGKTTFIKGVVAGASGLSPDEVSSPTFLYVHHYEGKKTVHHFDLYRLRGSDHFFELGLDEFFGQGVCCIEWAERIPQVLPAHAVPVHIEYLTEESRLIRYGE